MYSTQGVVEAYAALFAHAEQDISTSKGDLPARALYIAHFMLGVNDMEDAEMQKAFLKKYKKRAVTPAQTRKYAAMETEEFATLLYNIATENGSDLYGDSDKILIRCMYAAYVYSCVAAFLGVQSSTFALVPQNKGINALALINTGILDLDQKTKKGKVIVDDVTFEIENYQKGEVSTGALMLNDILLSESKRRENASIAIPVRALATIKGRSTSKQAILKLRNELVAQMDELAPIGFRGKEKIDGKWHESGSIKINGGTHIIKDGVLYWNYNADLFKQFSALAPMDLPKELWKVDPRTNQYYFGRYIAQNWRINEGKKGRTKIMIKTLISKSPNLPTYETVMQGNRNVSDRIIKKTFADLDALETLYYDAYTADGQLVENPAEMGYEDFINGYIVVDYSDYPAHPKRIKQRTERKKKAEATKEKRQLKDAAKEESGK